jgi:MerR, DNA binding
LRPLGFTLDEVADLLDAGHRHTRPDAGLRERARAKLAEVEAKIADLQVIAGTLRAAVEAGCDDLVACAGEPCCPIPFATIAQERPMPTPVNRARRLGRGCPASRSPSQQRRAVLVGDPPPLRRRCLRVQLLSEARGPARVRCPA